MISYELWDIIESRIPIVDWWAFQLWIEQRRYGDDTRQTAKICRWLRMRRDVEEYVNPAAFG